MVVDALCFALGNCVCVCVCQGALVWMPGSLCGETSDPNLIRLGNDVACLQLWLSANDECI